MRRAYLVLAAAAFVLTACGSAPATTAPSPSRSASPSPIPLIADTAMDVATCQQFAAEQAGQMSADQFDAWLLQNGGQTALGPDSSTGMDNTLSVNLGDWYAVQATGLNRLAARDHGDLAIVQCQYLHASAEVTGEDVVPQHVAGGS
jgi:hypothetical protein